MMIPADLRQFFFFNFFLQIVANLRESSYIVITYLLTHMVKIIGNIMRGVITKMLFEVPFFVKSTA